MRILYEINKKNRFSTNLKLVYLNIEIHNANFLRDLTKYKMILYKV